MNLYKSYDKLASSLHPEAYIKLTSSPNPLLDANMIYTLDPSGIVVYSDNAGVAGVMWWNCQGLEKSHYVRKSRFIRKARKVSASPGHTSTSSTPERYGEESHRIELM